MTRLTAADRERERLYEKARKWRERGMFTDAEYGAVMAVLSVDIELLAAPPPLKEGPR